MKRRTILLLLTGMIIAGTITNSAYAHSTVKEQISSAEHINLLEDNHVNVPDEYHQLFSEISKQYGISCEMMEAMCFTESRFDPNAVNGDCKGLMQISESSHSKRMAELGVSNLYDPEGNIRVAADYLLELFEQCGDYAVVLAVYNGDSHAFDEGYVSDYVKRVTDIQYALEKVHGK